MDLPDFRHAEPFRQSGDGFARRDVDVDVADRSHPRRRSCKSANTGAFVPLKMRYVIDPCRGPNNPWPGRSINTMRPALFSAANTGTSTEGLPMSTRQSTVVPSMVAAIVFSRARARA